MYLGYPQLVRLNILQNNVSLFGQKKILIMINRLTSFGLYFVFTNAEQFPDQGQRLLQGSKFFAGNDLLFFLHNLLLSFQNVRFQYLIQYGD